MIFCLSAPNNAFAGTPESIAALRGRLLGGAGQGERCLTYAHLAESALPSDTEHIKIRAIFHEAEEGGYWAEVPSIPGCATQGETMEELLDNLQDAVEGCISIEASPPAPQQPQAPA